MVKLEGVDALAKKNAAQLRPLTAKTAIEGRQLNGVAVAILYVWGGTARF
jgi:hypothetical protein